MRLTLRFLVATALFAFGSWAAPWLILPVIAGLLPLAAPRLFTPALLAPAAAAAWGGILGATALHAPVARLAAVVGGIIHLPGSALIALTIAVAGLLAWSAAEVACFVRRGDSGVR